LPTGEAGASFNHGKESPARHGTSQALGSARYPFSPDQRTWWENLEFSTTEKLLVRSDLDTLEFAQKQSSRWKNA